jgi:hypothetical protein
MPGTAQVINAARRQETVDYIGAVAAVSAAARPAAGLGAAARAALTDAAADANQRVGGQDHKVAVYMPAARRSDAYGRAGLQQSVVSRAQSARTGAANMNGQRVRPRPELRRPRP